jgi:predicted phosphate transport protein (TIGR00153 family)
MTAAIERTCEKAAEAINSLDELVATGFRGREVNRVEQLINELCALEGTTDRYERELVETLFQLEESMSPVSVMLWYKIIGWLGNVADCAEKVGNRLRLLIAR